jgi:hypothetical protein
MWPGDAGALEDAQEFIGEKVSPQTARTLLTHGRTDPGGHG